MKGNIRLIPITEVKEGIQVITTAYSSTRKQCDVLVVPSDEWGEKNKEYLEVLVIEYKIEDFKPRAGKDIRVTIKQLPILSPQWQEILDLGLVDKEVGFEVFDIPAPGIYTGNIELDPKSHPEAKVTLPKKKVEITEVDSGDYSVLEEMMQESWDDIWKKYIDYLKSEKEKGNGEIEGPYRTVLLFLKENYHPPKKK